jgi:hypothetical protein
MCISRGQPQERPGAGLLERGLARMTGPIEPQVGDSTPSVQAQHLAPLSRIILAPGGAVAVSRSMARSLSGSILSRACRLQPPPAYRRAAQARNEPRVAENGSSPSTSSSSEDSGSEGVSSPRALAIAQVAHQARLLCLCAHNSSL